MLDEKIIKLQHFFEVDNKIKKEMINIAPPSDSEYLDEASICKYTNKLYDSLLYIFSELKCIASDIFEDYYLSIMGFVSILENKIKNAFYSCGFDINKLRLFYKNYISNMEIDFVNLVKDECFGYSIKEITAPEKATTINEMLHFMHSFIVNSDDLLQSIPIISERNNNFNYPIVLRGYKTPIFEQLYDLFPDFIDVGNTDMVAINERKLLMMVRDRGHALTIEITLDNNKARLEYFIPKLCNVDMINKLPGVNKVNEDSIGATGAFEITIDDLPNSLYDFISKVPTDFDMVIKYH